MIEEDDLLPSKTQIKKEMNALQDLGLRLANLPQDTLNKINTLPEDLCTQLQQAFTEYKKITSRSALKRQAQYIGRLMREFDEEHIAKIEEYLSILDGSNQAHNAHMQRLEQWRTRLLNDNNSLTEFLNTYPHANSGELRTLIRNARKEQEASKPPKAFRALFQLIRQIDSEQSA